MRKKKVISAIVFVVVAMVSGGIVSYEMNKSSVDVKGAAQVETVDMVQTEGESTAQEDKVTFSCGVPGCTQTEVHQHGLCGIDGCVQIGEHSHARCGVAGCTETEVHMHNSCGVSGCTQTGEHSHERNSDGHHQSGHGGSHH